MTGRWKKSDCEIAKEEEDLRMRHHHYHCTLNPHGFLKLQIENFKNNEREAIKREAEGLRKKT